MGIKLSRKKSRSLLLTSIYRLQKLLPLTQKAKLKLYLNLEWIFNMLAHEMSFKHYSSKTHPVRVFSKKFILTHVNINHVVLDVGCSTGDLSQIISEHAKEVVGIDYDYNKIGIAKQKHKKNNLTFLHGEALEFLNTSKKQFDVLVLSHILEHLDDPKSFLLNFKDHFKCIYIELPDFDRYYLNHYRKELNLNLIYSDSDHISEFDREDLRILLKECQLKILDEEYRYGIQKLWCVTTK